jgi:ribonuclease G
VSGGIDRLLVRESAVATSIAAMAGDRLVEVDVAFKDRADEPDAIFLGRVEQHAPALDAAFVDIGVGRAGFLRAEDATQPFAELPPGTPVLVQVRRETTEDKGARLTMNLSLNARHATFRPAGEGVTFHRRIDDGAERARLLDLARVFAGERGEGLGGGLLLRPAAAGAPAERVLADLRALLDRWEGMRRLALRSAPPRAFPDPGLHPLLRRLRDEGAGLREIVVDDQPLALHARRLAQENGDRVEVRFVRPPPGVFEIDDAAGQIETALTPRIALASGVEVLFEPGETLTAIDVDSGRAGSHAGGGPSRALDVNLEAAAAIAQQIRLRNLGGAILIDFVTMKTQPERERVLRAFAEALAGDSGAQVAGFTRLGLLEMSRTRRGPTLAQALHDLADREAAAGQGMRA